MDLIKTPSSRRCDKRSPAPSYGSAQRALRLDPSVVALVVRALTVLARSVAHQDEAAETFTALEADTIMDANHRVEAAQELASLEGHREEGIALLTPLADDTSVDGWDRTPAAAALAKLGERGSAALLAAFADDTTRDRWHRSNAAASLNTLGLYRVRR
ncbi:hypothetical protein [Streptomyces altiplanensis]